MKSLKFEFENSFVIEHGPNTHEVSKELSYYEIRVGKKKVKKIQFYFANDIDSSMAL